MSIICRSRVAVRLAFVVALLSCCSTAAGAGLRRTSFILFQPSLTQTSSFGTVSTLVSSQATTSAEPPKASEDDSSPTTKTSQVTPTLESPLILYDGVCNFCNAWVDILLRIDLQKRYKFAPLQSDIGRKLLVDIGKDEDDISSVLLIRPNLDYYEKSAAPLRVIEELGPLAGALSRTALTIVPKEIRDSIYDTVAENRYNLMGKRDECRCGDPKYSDRFLS